MSLSDKTNGVPRQRVRTAASDEEQGGPHHTRYEKLPNHIPGMPDRAGLARFRDRFLRRGKRQIGVVESFKNIATSSCTCLHLRNILSISLRAKPVLNLFIVFLPISWVLHFLEKDHTNIIFACKKRRPGFLKVKLTILVKFRSSQSCLWSVYSITVVNKWLTTAGRTLAT